MEVCQATEAGEGSLYPVLSLTPGTQERQSSCRKKRFKSVLAQGPRDPLLLLLKVSCEARGPAVLPEAEKPPPLLGLWEDNAL